MSKKSTKSPFCQEQAVCWQRSLSVPPRPVSLPIYSVLADFASDNCEGSQAHEKRGDSRRKKVELGQSVPAFQRTGFRGAHQEPRAVHRHSVHRGEEKTKEEQELGLEGSSSKLSRKSELRVMLVDSHRQKATRKPCGISHTANVRLKAVLSMSWAPTRRDIRLEE